MWLLKLFLTLASSVAKYLNDKQLIDAGAGQAVASILEDALEKIGNANAARNSVSNDTNSVRNDTANRD